MIFNCSNCIFVQKTDDGEVQIDCSAKRLDKFTNFGLKFNSENNRYEFNRYCNYFRPPEWAALYGKDNNLIEVVKLESLPRITYVIDFNYDMDNLSNIISSINGNIGSIIVLNDKVEYNEDIMKLIDNKSKKKYIVQILADTYNDIDKFNEVFKYAKNGWCFFISKVGKLPADYYGILNSWINEKMNRLSYTKDDQTGDFIIQSALYKFLNRDINDNRSFDEKISELITDDKNSMIEWSALFNV